MAPIKLYGMMLSPNVTRVATVLNELGLEFDFVDVDLRTGAHKQPDFLKLNVRYLPSPASPASSLISRVPVLRQDLTSRR